MKKVAMLITASSLLAAMAPAFAQMTKQQKDECLVASKNCMGQVDTLQKRIHKLQTEIKKGNKVYSAEEIKKLQQKLKEADDMLKGIETGP